jgi:BirA family biotin operon repressor/biotin-[acetyl-CoA-carboxylase] ligase
MKDNVIFLDQIDSTNNYAKHQIRSGGVTGCGMIVASVQTRGRGRGRRKWHSDNDLGLWATLFFSPAHQTPFALVMKTSVALVLTLQDAGLAAYIKWPNDIEIKKRKISGLLAETFDKNVIVGLGVNLRQAKGDFPVTIKNKATSFYLENGARMTNREFLKIFFSHFELNGSEDRDYHRYRRLLGIRGAHMKINREPIIVEDVGQDGCLMGLDKQNRKKKYYSGTLAWH